MRWGPRVGEKAVLEVLYGAVENEQPALRIGMIVVGGPLWSGKV